MSWILLLNLWALSQNNFIFKYILKMKDYNGNKSYIKYNYQSINCIYDIARHMLLY